MPSPIAHLAAGYVVYHLASPASGHDGGARPRRTLLAFAVAMALLPDMDSVAGLVLGDFGRYHNNISHSFFVAAVVALVIASIAVRFAGQRFLFWFGFAFACYASHIVLDFFTWGRGVLALWPVIPDRVSPPVVLFYGFHWSQGLISARHLWTFLTEAPVAAAAVLSVRRLVPLPSRG